MRFKIETASKLLPSLISGALFKKLTYIFYLSFEKFTLVKCGQFYECQALIAMADIK
jgi:hypothetical protein